MTVAWGLEMALPKVVVYGQCSVDGRITFGRDVLLMPWGASAEAARRWGVLAGPEPAQDRIARMHSPGAYLEGADSFVGSVSGPASLPAYSGEGNHLYEDFLPDKVVLSPERQGWMAVPDSRGRVRWSTKQGSGIHLLVLVTHSTPPPYLDFLRAESIPYLVVGNDRVDLAEGLAAMRRILGVETVVCTSPGKLGGALLRAGLVDEIDIDFFPAVIGGFNTPSLFAFPELRPEEWPARLHLLSAEVREGGHVLLRYRVLAAPGVPPDDDGSTG